MNAIEFDRVGKTFGDTTILKDLNLEIPEGEFTIVVGPSGCGKSTLLRLLAGLEEITDGEIRIHDRVVNDLEPRERDIAMVFQNYALYPHMSVYNNMAYSLKIRRFSKADIRKRIEQTADILQLDQALLKRRPGQLSGGQRQRVAMGRAIVRQPKVFLFDEPLSNLDAKLRVQMRLEIKRLHHQLGITTLYVTHDQVEAMTLGQRLVVMNGGRIEQVGSPSRLYDRPATRFVAGFLGSPAMNFLDGDVGEDRASVRLDGGVSIALAGSLAEAEPGQPVIVGIRPEHWTRTEANEQALTATVELIEDLGPDSLVHAQHDGTEIVLRVTGHCRLQVDERIHLMPSESGLVHVFDQQTDQRLALVDQNPTHASAMRHYG